MNDLLDSEFEHELRDTMQRLATRGVPSVARRTPSTSRSDASAGARTDSVVTLTDHSAHSSSRRRERVAVAAALLALVGVIGTLIALSGPGRDGGLDTATATPAEWRILAPAPLAARTAPASVWTGTEWIIWSGTFTMDGSSGGADDGTGSPTTDGLYSDGAAYDPVSDRWRPIAEAPIPPRQRAKTVWTGTEMLVMGGEDGDGGNPFDDAAAYDPATDEWRELSSLSSVVDGRAPVSHLYWAEDRALVISVATGTTGLWSYKPEVDEWSPIENTIADYYSGVFVFSPDHMFAPMADGVAVHRLDDLNRPAEVVPWPSGRSRLNDMKAVWTGAELFVVGHQQTPAGSEMHTFRYNPATATMRQADEVGTRPLTTELAVVEGSVLRFDPFGQASTLVQVFNLARGEWRNLPEAPLDLNRAEMSIADTGEELLLWGGHSGSIISNDAASLGQSQADGVGLRLDSLRSPEVAEEWSALAPSPLSAREEHVAVWTGTEMIVWGGRFQPGGAVTEGEDGGVFVTETSSDVGLAGLRDGAAYNPTTDSWRPIPDAPFGGVYKHRAVWTGTEMVVVGPSPTSGSFDAAAFDPVSDSWRRLEAPEISSGAGITEFIATDDRLLLFAGSPVDDTADTTVFAFDTSAEQWTTLSTLADVPRVTGAVVIDGSVRAVGHQLRDGVLVDVSIRADDLGDSLWGWTSLDYSPDPNSATSVWIAADGAARITVAGDWGIDVVTTFYNLLGDGPLDEGGRPVQSFTESHSAVMPLRFFDHLAPIDLFVTPAGDLIILDGIINHRGAGARRSADGGWSRLPPLPVAVEFGHSGVWTGEQIIVWGGRAAENGGPSVATGAQLFAS